MYFNNDLLTLKQKLKIMLVYKKEASYTYICIYVSTHIHTTGTKDIDPFIQLVKNA